MGSQFLLQLPHSGYKKMSSHWLFPHPQPGGLLGVDWYARMSSKFPPEGEISTDATTSVLISPRRGKLWDITQLPNRTITPAYGAGITSVMTSFYSLSGVVGAKIATPLITILKKPMW